MKHTVIKAILGVLIMLTVLAAVGCAAGAPEAAPTEQAAQAPATAEPTQEAAESTQEAAESTQEAAETATPDEKPEELVLTLEELAQFDGQDGRPAYIAVEGVVYDVSAIAAWMGGKHREYFAGQDITEPIKSISPHGVKVLSNLPKVGELVE